MSDQPPSFGPFVPNYGTTMAEAMKQFIAQLRANPGPLDRLTDDDIDRLDFSEMDNLGRMIVSLDGEELFTIHVHFPDLS
jgi:hypothetical protein